MVCNDYRGGPSQADSGCFPENVFGLSISSRVFVGPFCREIEWDVWLCCDCAVLVRATEFGPISASDGSGVAQREASKE